MRRLLLARVKREVHMERRSLAVSVIWYIYIRIIPSLSLSLLMTTGLADMDIRMYMEGVGHTKETL